MRLRRSSRILGDLVETKTARLPYPKAARVEGRDVDGATKVRLLDGICEARLGVTGARKGEIITAPAGQVRASRGTGGVPVATLLGGRATLWVERLEPDILCRGEEPAVTVIGRGFTPSTRFEFLLPDSTAPNPAVVVLAQRFLDSEHIELDLQIDAQAPLVQEAPLAYGERTPMPATRLPSIKDSAYHIAQCETAVLSVDAVFLVLYSQNGNLVASGHAEDGTYLDDLSAPLEERPVGRAVVPGSAESLGQGVRVARDEPGVAVLDLLSGQIYRHESSPPWAAAEPMLVAGKLYWFEYETGSSAQSLGLRLLRADDLTLSGVTVVRQAIVEASIVIGEWTPLGQPTRGHDFTDTHAAIWISWVDGNFETFGWERMVFALDGSTVRQASGALHDIVPEVGLRAGLPIGPHQSLQQRTDLEEPPETEAFPLQQWSAPTHDPDTPYRSWGDAPSAIDIALDRNRTRVYVLTPTEIQTYDLTSQILLASVALDQRSPGAVGIHRLETPIPVVLDSGDEGGEESEG